MIAISFLAISLVVVVVVGLLTLAAGGQVFADPLQGANKQRIGGYDVEMLTVPGTPIADDSGSPTDILIRIAGVDGNDLVNVPITVRIVKDDGIELHRTNPIIVPYGHYAHEFTFTQAGTYMLYIDLNDYRYSGEALTFTFFINVAGSLDYMLYVAAPSVALVAVGTASMAVFIKKKKNKEKEQKADNTEI